ncbi:hypothetical protein CLOM_g15414 [Closterium sp. NIES-68]|nr:hypothetical protein CLOM_g15414 [Closterium sp. NIES-68]
MIFFTVTRKLALSFASSNAVRLTKKAAARGADVPREGEIRAVRLNPFANRLSSRGLPLAVQRLRCRCNFHSLRFLLPIRAAATTALHRLNAHATSVVNPHSTSAAGVTAMSPHSPPLLRPPAPLLPWILPPPLARARASGVFVAVHVRFERDMLAFSRCSFSSSRTLQRDLERYREFGWSKFQHRSAWWGPLMPLLGGGTHEQAEGQGEKAHGSTGSWSSSNDTFSSSGAEGAQGVGESARSLREAGHCPLTPLEVALFMRAAGVPPSMPVFVASGALYGPPHLMAAFTALYPRMLTKAHLLSPHDLRPFQGHASQLAAIDYLIALRAPLLVLSHGSNFGHVLTGQRRYLHGGRAGVLKPDKRRLAKLYSRTDLSWPSFQTSVRALLRVAREAEEKVEGGGHTDEEVRKEITGKGRGANTTAWEVGIGGSVGGTQGLGMYEGGQKQDKAKRKGRMGGEKENDISPYVVPQKYCMC